MRFHDFTVLATGDKRSHRQHDSDELEPAAVEVFHGLLARNGPDFRADVHPHFPRIQLQWTREGESALATFWSGQTPLTISALVAGSLPATDRQVLQHLQQSIVRIFADTPIEPGFDLLAISQRPAIITVPLLVPPSLREDLEIAADMETCLAAAFFLGRNR